MERILEMERTLEDVTLSLQSAVTSARQAGIDQDVTGHLQQLAMTLELLAKTVTAVNEVTSLISKVLDPNSSDSISTSSIEEVVSEIWSNFVQGNYRPFHDGYTKLIVDKIGLEVIQWGEFAWTSYRSKLLSGIDMDVVLPHPVIVQIIDSKLTIPADFSISQDALRNMVGQSFKYLWEGCGENAQEFLTNCVELLKVRIDKFTKTLGPIMKAIGTLPVAVKSTLENALSTHGADLRQLDDPEMITWINSNPSAKDFFVVRFKETN